jgi:hypothetical protein
MTSRTRAVRQARPLWLGDPRRCLTADSALLALAALTAAACLMHASGGARPVLVALGAGLIPGAAVLTRLPAQDPLDAIALAVALSLCIEAAGALVMIWTGWWHPVGWALALSATACTALGLDARNALVRAGGKRP